MHTWFFVSFIVKWCCKYWKILKEKWKKIKKTLQTNGSIYEKERNLSMHDRQQDTCQ